MKLQAIENFLTVVQEGNISKAAQYLHLTQPTLSRQLKELEEELNTQLFNRGNRKIELTEEGKIFYKRAQEISALVKRAEDEIRAQDNISGDIYIGAAETNALSHIGKVIKSIQKDYPEIKFHIISGDKEDLLDRLDNGLFDFCLIFGDFNRDKYDYLELPYKNYWVLISKNTNNIQSDSIKLEELKEMPLLFSRQSLTETKAEEIFKIKENNLNIVATYNLVNNAVILAKEGVGSVLTLDHLVNTDGTDLITRKIEPEILAEMYFISKKNNRPNKVMKIFTDRLNKYIKEKTSEIEV